MQAFCEARKQALQTCETFSPSQKQFLLSCMPFETSAKSSWQPSTPFAQPQSFLFSGACLA
jgi:hypothetical protein